MFDEKFWLAIAFLSFVALVLKYVLPMISKQLDAKSKQIAQDILAAKEMKEQAEKMLKLSEQRYQEALEIAQNLVKDAANDAKKYLEDASKAAQIEIAKKLEAVEGRIKQEQENAVRQMKIKIIDAALQDLQNNIGNAQKSQSDNVVKKSIDSLSKLVH